MKAIQRQALIATLIGLCSALPLAVHAEWTGNIEGEQVLDGDDEGSRIRFKMSNNQRPFDQEVYVDWFRTDAGSSYGVGYDPQYWFTNQTYVFGTARLRTSSSDLVENVRTLGAGLGIQLLDSNTQELSAEIGAIQTATKFEEALPPDNEDTFTETATTANITGEQSISDLLKLGLSLNYIDGESSTTTATSASIKLRIPGGSVVYNYRLRNTELDGGEKTETSGSSVSFEYDF